MGLELLGLLSEPDPGEQMWVMGWPTDNQWVRGQWCWCWRSSSFVVVFPKFPFLVHLDVMLCVPLFSLFPPVSLHMTGGKHHIPYNTLIVYLLYLVHSVPSLGPRLVETIDISYLILSSDLIVSLISHMSYIFVMCHMTFILLTDEHCSCLLLDDKLIFVISLSAYLLIFLIRASIAIGCR